MVKASDWVLKRNPKLARKAPTGPVAKVALANLQSKPAQKILIISLAPSGLRGANPSHL